MSEILYIRYYNQDLYRNLSGIAIGKSAEKWELISRKFSQTKLDELIAQYPKAQLQRFPLPDSLNN